MASSRQHKQRVCGRNLIEQARAVKAAHPNTPTSIYLDAQLAEPFQTAVGAAMRDPSMADFFLRDARGETMTQNVFCRSMPGMVRRPGVLEIRSAATLKYATLGALSQRLVGRRPPASGR